MESPINKYTVTEHVSGILWSITGENASREGLRDTPERVARMYMELLSGYDCQAIAKLYQSVFEDDNDEMVILRGIEFTSLCEHHLMPFSGTITIGYLPAGKVLGLSKMVRVVDAFSHRLQIQERLVKQIAESIAGNLRPKGVAVIGKAIHSCMACRGVMQRSAETITSCMYGVFREDGRARSEFLSLAQ